MPAGQFFASLDSEATTREDAAIAQRWKTWQQRGLAGDARSLMQMRVLAAILAVAVVGRLGWVVFGNS